MCHRKDLDFQLGLHSLTRSDKTLRNKYKCASAGDISLLREAIFFLYQQETKNKPKETEKEPIKKDI